MAADTPTLPNDCPPADRLRRMLEGATAGPDAEAVERHVDACPVCQGALEAMTADPDRHAADDDPTTRPDAPPTLPSHLADGGLPGPAPLPAIPGYEVLGELGRGGMGVVYRARQVRAGRPVALKMVLHGDRVRPDDLVRFRLEAESLARLQHPNIIPVYEVGEADGLPFYSMEYVDGGTLADALKDDPRPLGPDAAAALAATVARAVHAAHQAGVVHRDLKPANILLAGRAGDGTGSASGSKTGSKSGLPAGTPKVTDFGLAKVIGEDSGLTRTGQVMGTPSYMAPEQASGGAPVGVPCDVYALGAILYELLAGRPPFRGASAWETMMKVVHEAPEPPSRHRPGVPRDLELVCLKCLAKEPSGRYASADALAEDLRRYLAREPIAARRSGAFRRARLWARRHPAPAALAVLLLSAVAVGVAGVFAQWRRAERNLAESRANFALARQAVDDLLTRIAHNKLFNRPGFQGLRRELLADAAAFYGRLAARSAADPSLRAEVVRARTKLGNIELILGRPDRAEAELKAAVDESGPAPRPADLELARVEALCRLSEARSQQGRGRDGLAPAEEAVAAAGAVAAPGVEARRAEAVALVQRGHILAGAGRAADAERDYRRSIRVLEALGTTPEADPGGDTARELANGALHLAYLISRGAGEPGAVLEALDDAVARCRAAADRAGGSPEHLADLAAALNIRGNFLGQILERWDESRASLQAARDLSDRLARENPLVPDYRVELATAEFILGYAELRRARFRDAEACYRRATDGLDAVLREDPARADALAVDRGSVLIDLAEVRRRLGDPAGGAAILRDRCIPLAREAIDRGGGASQSLRILHAMAHRYLARCLLDAGDAPGAADAARRADALLAPSADAPDADAINREELARIRLNLGESLRALGQAPAADEALARAIAIAEELAKANPDAPDRADILAYARARRHALRQETGHPDRDPGQAAQAAAKLAGLPADDPDRLARLAAALVIAGKPPAEALKVLDRAEAGGFASPAALRTDPDLAPLRDLPGYADLLRRVEARSAAGRQ